MNNAFGIIVAIGIVGLTALGIVLRFFFTGK